MAMELIDGASIVAVAFKYGVSTATVSLASREFPAKCDAPSPPSATSPLRIHANTMVPPDIWEQINWSRQDTEIARVLNLSRERIRQKRRELGKPDAESKHSKPTMLQLREWVRANRESLSGLILVAMVQRAASAGIEATVPTMRAVAISEGVTVGKASSVYTLVPWDRVNWGMPNKAIAEAWRVRTHRVSQYRSTHLLGPATISRKSQECEIAAAAERAKADEWRASVPRQLWPENISNPQVLQSA
jgi:hypothetical protein